MRPIDADAMIDRLKAWDTKDKTDKALYSFTLNRINEQPTIQPVRHGHWETVDGWDGDELYRCSECGDEFVLIEGTPKDNNYCFCPHCGADMRGEQNG